MSLPRLTRFLMLVLASGVLAIAAALWSGVRPAAASLPSSVCTQPLEILCTPTTVAKTSPSTSPPTTAPTTTSPTVVHKTTTTVASSKQPTVSTAATPKQPTGAASVGVNGLPLSGSVSLPPLGTGTDPAAAPQLAGSASPTTTAAAATPPAAISGLVGTTAGLPNDHATLRIALSVLALLIAAVAVAQLPASRRSAPADTDRLA